ncbi:MAG: hypothetical protein AAFP81_17440 [Pseudomonadota bacterium]
MKPIDPNIKIVPRHPWAPENGFQILYRETKAWTPQRDEHRNLMLWPSRKDALDWLIEEGLVDPLRIGRGDALVVIEGGRDAVSA